MNILKKVIALSDIHVFNNKRFNEHDYIFNLIDKKLSVEKPELILLLGDVVDSKNKLSPEQLVLVRKLFILLSKHSRVAYIIGNHDRTLQSDKRIDSLSTIVSTIENPENEIFFFEKSQVYDLGYDNCKFAVWSWIENNKKPEIIKNDNDYIIGLFHGVINGAVTSAGHKLSGGVDLDEFSECDIVIAGDIHNKTGFRNGEINYVSSLLQVSVNEDPYGSFSIYEWKNNGFDMRRVEVKNPFAIQSINVDEYDINQKIEEGVKKIRLRYDTDSYNRKDVKRIAKKIEEKHGVKVTVFPVLKKKTIFNVSDNGDTENVTTDYFNKFLEANKSRLELSEKDIESIKWLNKEFTTGLETEFELGDYTVKNLVINNLLSYPLSDTVIDLSREGLIGILGKNRAGKSSIIKILQFVLFGELPANSVLFSFLNKKNRDKSGFAEVIFEKAGKYYKIERNIIPKKNKKADSTVSFYEIDESGEIITDLNKENKTATDKEIRKYLGLNSYFEMLSIFSSQKKQTEFIDCKNAERLALLNKFLNLQEYAEKEELAKSKIKIDDEVLKRDVSKYNNNYDINDLESELKEIEEAIISHNEILALNEKEKEKTQEEYDRLNKLWITNYDKSKKNANKGDLLLNQGLYKDDIDRLRKAKEIAKETILEIDNDVSVLIEHLNSFSEQAVNEMSAYNERYGLNKFKLYSKDLSSQKTKIALLKKEINDLEEQAKKKLCEVCGSEIKQKVINDILVKAENLRKELEEEQASFLLNENDNKDALELYNEIMGLEEKVDTLYDQKRKLNVKNDNIESEVKQHDLKIEVLEGKISAITKQLEEIDEVLEAKKVINEIEEEYNSSKSKLKELDIKHNELYKEEADLKSKLSVTKEKLKESVKLKLQIDEAEKKLSLLKKYREITSKKGLPLYVLNKNIGSINDKINAIVSQVFDFELKFEVNDEKGEASITFIYPDDEETNEVTLASGSETFLINLCVKVGLSQISQLPKINTLFIDEGYDVLDSESIAKLPDVFDVLRNYYNNVITIVHLEEIKQLLDYNINLEKRNGYTVLV